MATSNEISTEDVPDSIKNKINEILQNERFISKTSFPKGAADLFNYKITFEGEGANSKVIECNQITMNKDLKDLVRYIETNSNKYNAQKSS